MDGRLRALAMRSHDFGGRRTYGSSRTFRPCSVGLVSEQVISDELIILRYRNTIRKTMFITIINMSFILFIVFKSRPLVNINSK